MTEREALKRWLEALENSIDTVRNEYEKDWRHGLPTRKAQLDQMKQMLEQHEQAIIEIKEVLAQPEQKPVAVRYKYKFKDIGETGAYEYHSYDFACLTHQPKGESLYTTPPQRTWVGLTDEDVQAAWDAMKDYDDFDTYTEVIEAKLKEKNT